MSRAHVTLYWMAACSVVLGAIPRMALHAQQPSDLRAGDRVRLHGPAILSAPLVGEVERIAGDTLYVREQRSRARRVVLARSLTRVDLSLGSTPRRSLVKRDALAGAGVGAAAGVAVGLADRCGPIRQADANCAPRAAGVVQGLALGAAAGSLLGAIVGLVRPAERWERLLLPLRLSNDAGTAEGAGVTRAPER